MVKLILLIFLISSFFNCNSKLDKRNTQNKITSMKAGDNKNQKYFQYYDLTSLIGKNELKLDSLDFPYKI